MSENCHTYVSIDLKSFYASVECIERRLNPLTTHLVVADARRTEKTICLAVSPSLKAYGISGRARLFEVVQRVKEINQERRSRAPHCRFTGSSCHTGELEEHPELELSYIIAPPRMAFYIEYSTIIYNIYLKYIAPEDIHVYSIDEVFMDVTHYLKTYRMNPRQLTAKIIQDVFDTTGITAAAGIGTNLYLCKVAMDIVAKHVEPDPNGVRIAELDELSYRKLLWNHRPLTDFWRVGHGYQKKLEEVGLFTMGDIARCSLGSDIVFDPLLIKAVLESPEATCLALNAHPLSEEEIKVIPDAEGRVAEISKTCSIEEAVGESIGVEKMSPAYTSALVGELDRMILGEKQVNLFYEAAFERLIPQGKTFGIVDTTSYFSMELDTVEDFLQATGKIPPHLL